LAPNDLGRAALAPRHASHPVRAVAALGVLCVIVALLRGSPTSNVDHTRNFPAPQRYPY
jgi:hypothetical protein